MKCIILVDEIAFMPPDFMKKVIIPLMMTGAIFFWITTIDDADNMINTIVDNINSGKIDFINFMQHSLACIPCRDLGKATECTHKVVEHPKWNNPKTIQKIRALMGDDKTFFRETLGLPSIEESERAFPEKFVKLLKESDRVDLTYYEPKYIYTSIDPAAGGYGSNYAIVSSVFVGGKLVIVGVDQIRTHDPDQVDDLVIKHFRTIKTIKIKDTCPLIRATPVFIPEALGGYEHYRMAKVLRSNGINCIELTENAGRLGLLTTNFLKGKMANDFKVGLERQQYAFAQQFVTNSKKPDQSLYTAEEMINELCTQLITFEKRYKYVRGNEMPTVVYTGKGANKCDDLVMALLLGEEGRQRFDLNANKLYNKP